MPDTQLAVVGGGPGGYVAAFKAADLGVQVTLVELGENPGGVCLYRGCIPSKALLHVSKLLNEAKEAAEWGITFGEPQIDFEKLNSWKDHVVGYLTGGLGQLARARKITYIRGRATFLDPHTLQIDRTDGGAEQLSFEHAILATGSCPTVIPTFDIGSERVMDSTSALELRLIPKSLLVVGGGIVGLELGTVYASLGSTVSVVEMLPGLVPPADRDLVVPLERRLEKLFDKIMVSTTVTQIAESADGIEVDFEDADGNTSSASYERLLISVGRTPNSRDLGLENTAVRVDERGFVQVDVQRRTAEPSIFAIGDVIGSGLAHTASHEGAAAAEVIAGHDKVAFEPNAIPNVVYTDPEIAWCGLTEEEANQQGRAVEISRFPWAASGRATTVGRNEGVTKLIVDPETDRILGVGIVGVGAGELISEGVLAIEMAAQAKDVLLTIHPHPTLSETVMEAAETYYGLSPHIYAPKKNR